MKSPRMSIPGMKEGRESTGIDLIGEEVDLIRSHLAKS